MTPREGNKCAPLASNSLQNSYRGVKKRFQEVVPKDKKILFLILINIWMNFDKNKKN